MSDHFKWWVLARWRDTFTSTENYCDIRSVPFVTVAYLTNYSSMASPSRLLGFKFLAGFGEKFRWVLPIVHKWSFCPISLSEFFFFTIHLVVSYRGNKGEGKVYWYDSHFARASFLLKIQNIKTGFPHQLPDFHCKIDFSLGENSQQLFLMRFG